MIKKYKYVCPKCNNAEEVDKCENPTCLKCNVKMGYKESVYYVSGDIPPKRNKRSLFDDIFFGC